MAYDHISHYVAYNLKCYIPALTYDLNLYKVLQLVKYTEILADGLCLVLADRIVQSLVSSCR